MVWGAGFLNFPSPDAKRSLGGPPSTKVVGIEV